MASNETAKLKIQTYLNREDWALRILSSLGPILLVWSCILLLPFGRLVELPVLVMAVAGLVLLNRRREFFMNSPSARLFTIVFLAAWVPIVVSLLDAIDLTNGARVALAYPRFYFSGLFIIYAINTPVRHRVLLALASIVLVIWVIDGYVQLFLGRDIFGFEANPTRINALFGDRNPKFGIMLAIFSPLLFEYVRRNFNRIVLTVCIIGTVSMVLIAGTRSSWITLAVILAAYVFLVSLRERRIPWRLLGIAFVASALTVGTLYLSSERFALRLNSAIAGITGRAEVTQSAVGHRVFIWKGAINMIASHPINGVGARGFRDAFPAHAVADDPFVNRDSAIIPTHSHQLVLELLAETGLIGLLGTILLITLLARAALRAGAVAQKGLLPYGICLIAAYFPLNTHLAIYSSLWSQVLWWLVAVYCSGISLKLDKSLQMDPA